MDRAVVVIGMRHVIEVKGLGGKSTVITEVQERLFSQLPVQS